ncbi:hypothetical protein LSH36_526g00006 [Paralvinella palmiformis]|uniref:Uncharacterized protein n=1 Tax=Paralvinella palmiformis TaxID=53620 RepID=A0AAD9MWE6_9ANNE|nr:hypothetical protein LSH36_526g00006 [Paralvinella palmiformis]
MKSQFALQLINKILRLCRQYTECWCFSIKWVEDKFGVCRIYRGVWRSGRFIHKDGVSLFTSCPVGFEFDIEAKKCYSSEIYGPVSGRDVVELCHDILPGSLPIEPKDAAQMEHIMEVAAWGSFSPNSMPQERVAWDHSEDTSQPGIQLASHPVEVHACLEERSLSYDSEVLRSGPRTRSLRIDGQLIRFWPAKPRPAGDTDSANARQGDETKRGSSAPALGHIRAMAARPTLWHMDNGMVIGSSPV